MTYQLLLVEDHEEQRDALILQIKQRCPTVEIITAGSVAEATSLLEKRQLHLTVLDLGLPDGGGFNVLERIRKGIGRTPLDSPVAVYSALDPDAVAHIAEHRGASGYFPKTRAGLAELLDWIERTLFELRIQKLRSGEPTSTRGSRDPSRRSRSLA